MNATELFEKLKKQKRKIDLNGETRYIVEGDLILTETDLFAYAVRRVAEEQAMVPGVLAPVREPLVGMTDDSGRIVRWKKGLVLTYWVQRNTFIVQEQYDLVVRSMRQATAAWEAVCGVNFRHMAELDESGPVPGGEQPIFRVVCYDTGGEFIAAAFFPNYPPPQRIIYIDPSFFHPNLGFDPVGVLRHELGHVLGFRHEHIRSGAPPECPNEDLDHTIDFTQYDPESVMHYFCGGVGTRQLNLTAKDRDGARFLYGPPDKEVTYYE